MLPAVSGYIKRLPAEEFEAQSRGGKGKSGAKLSTEEDSVAHFFACNDHDSVLFVTDKGNFYIFFSLPLLLAYSPPLPPSPPFPFFRSRRLLLLLLFVRRVSFFHRFVFLKSF